ncbi:MAG: ATP-binding cassette domain-containing protein, partial [Clostridia bacterium]
KTCAEIGFVAQNPDSQIVTDKVWRELAFGLENIGEKNDVIMRKIGEMASYFGIEQLFHSSTAELSGGQKQLLNLASVMVMNPKVLLLDEPTAQLDPIASANFIATLQRVNRELGITIVIAEHHLEQLFSIADKVVIMQNGKVVAVDTPRAIASQLRERQGQSDTQIDSLNAIGLPTCARVFTALYGEGDCPLTLQEGRVFLKKNFKNEIKSLQDKKVEIHCDCKQNCVELNSDDGGKVAELNKAVKKSKTVELNGGDSDKVAELNKVASERHAALEIKNCWFRYEKSAPDILRGLSLTLCQGEIFCLVGGNGVGKSTLLKVASGQVKSYQGKIKVFGKAIDSYKGGSLYRHGIAYLPQNVQEVFLKDNVAADFAEMVKTLDYANGAQYIKICLDALEVADLACRNPFDLSGGQQQKVALAKILLLQPKIILLDEPTKGIDAAAKLQLAQGVRKLASLNIAIVIVSHD